ncbi:hypothetical protein B7486_63210, partial [cyanobacterium TDX16]
MDAPEPPLVSLPSQPAGVPWPTHAWPVSDEHATLARAVDDGGGRDLLQDVARFGETWALLVLQGGRLVWEGYGPGHAAEQTLRSWSVAKSVLHAAVGVALHDGHLGPHDTIAAPEWGEGDARQAITVEHCLRMEDGLRWDEDYAEGATASDVQEMLFGSGKADVGAYAAGQPLAHGPGTVHAYSSGTSNLLSRRLGHAVGPGDRYQRWLDDRLFGPIGMQSALPRLDAAGTWIASSYVFATARDLAR